jgi:simple sugar transport system ATP-binding protein
VFLVLSHISKRFGPLVALDDVSFDVAPGEVHALVGENGAGKTTLMRIAYGMLQPDIGSVQVTSAGRRRYAAPVHSPADARAAGIGMVHQHFTSIPALSVGENIALSAGWRETGRRAERRAAGLIARLGFPIEAGVRVQDLSAQLRQRLEVVKALAVDAHVLLLDEPSAVLAPREVAELLRLVKDFVARGGAVVLITHKLDEVFAVADRVTVLRRGRVVLSGALPAETPQSLARAMIGGDMPVAQPAHRAPGEVTVRAVELALASGRRQTVTGASFALRAGEIIGVAAIEGNGQRELLRALAGLAEVRRVSGELTVTAPVAFIPEDRTTEGLIPELTLTENVLLGALDTAKPWVDWDDWSRRTERLMVEYDVRAAGPDEAAASLSGGNQQKLLLARALERQPRVLVAENPTRGLDVLATEAIHARLRAVAHDGVTVVVHSSDLDEVLALADRVLVVAGGKVSECPSGSSREVVGDAMLGLVGTG